ncbi:MAG: GreA/GreB family elongation factor [Flavobacteriales bacterium]|nr:GreA/GreB family elongation factor [Flavobacteriales bacterium]
MKQGIYNRCWEIASEKANSLEAEMASMRQAVQTESKSTAGDKHETGRAMIHLEQEKLHQQLAEAQQLLAELEQIKPDQPCETVQKGALVKTNRTTFYIAIGLGKINTDEKDIFVVSSQSPIGKQMLGKRLGESFNMNGTEYVITSVE